MFTPTMVSATRPGNGPSIEINGKTGSTRILVEQEIIRIQDGETGGEESIAVIKAWVSFNVEILGNSTVYFGSIEICYLTDKSVKWSDKWNEVKRRYKWNEVDECLFTSSLRWQCDMYCTILKGICSFKESRNIFEWFLIITLTVLSTYDERIRRSDLSI